MRETRLVWDLPVRLTHWLLAGAVLGCYSTSRFASKFILHKYFGCAVLILASFRIAWGFVGTRHARFSNFLAGPAKIRIYLSTVLQKSHSDVPPGHNPLGGWSIMAMLVLMMAQAVTGLFANDDVASIGPLYGWVSSPHSTILTGFHHMIFKGIVALVGLHLLAIGFYVFVLKINLLRPMVTGRKPSDMVPKSQAIDDSSSALAIIIIAILVCALSTILALAPKVSLSIF